MATVIKFSTSGFLVLTLLLVIFATVVLAEDATGTTTTRPQRLKEIVEVRRENVENRIANIKEKFATREAALKARLETFKNKQKAQIAERVSTNLNKINQNQTDIMIKHLERMSQLLDKLENRNPQAARTGIARARDAIASASAAVNVQADKDYTLQLTTESKIRADSQNQRQKLHDDLKAVRLLVIEAKQAVGNAIRTAKSGKPVKEGTSSGQ